MKGSLLDAIAQGPVLGDGAMGTMLLREGLTGGTSPLLWNVDRPEVVGKIHRHYAEAGAKIVTTNSFSGAPTNLVHHKLGDRVAELNAASVKIAKKATGGKAWVFANVGPFGDFLEPLGATTVDAVRAAFREQLEALHAAGADGVMVETMVDPRELAAAVAEARSVASWPIIATYAFQMAGAGGFRTMMGSTVADALNAAYDAGADASGANCGTGLSLDDYGRLAGELGKAARGRPVMIQPNAGAPHVEGDRLIYRATPEQMADLVPKLLDSGISLIGGCCGTTPDHIRAMGNALAQHGK